MPTISGIACGQANQALKALMLSLGCLQAFPPAQARAFWSRP